MRFYNIIYDSWSTEVLLWNITIPRCQKFLVQLQRLLDNTFNQVTFIFFKNVASKDFIIQYLNGSG
jgi:hypothetical protein